MKQLLVAGLVLLLSACASKPDFDYDKSVDFSQYKSFAWMPSASLTRNTQGAADYQINGLMERRVQQAVAAELAAKGMQQVEPAQADILINYHASVETKVDVDTIDVGYGARWNYWGVGYSTQTTTHEYDVGTLVVDVIDRQQNELVWRSAKEGRLSKNQSPEERTQAIRESVSDMFTNFPPQAQE